MKFCNEKELFKTTLKKILEIHDILEQVYYKPIDKLTQEHIDDDSIHYYLILNLEFFTSKYKEEQIATKVLKNLFLFMMEKMKKYQYESS